MTQTGYVWFTPYFNSQSFTINAPTVHCSLCFAPCWRQGLTLETMEGNSPIQTVTLFSFCLTIARNILGKASSQYTKQIRHFLKRNLDQTHLMLPLWIIILNNLVILLHVKVHCATFVQDCKQTKRQKQEIITCRSQHDVQMYVKATYISMC